MDDRNLLEMAAKAVGYHLVWGDVFKVGLDEVDCSDLPYVKDESPDVAPWYWNPLTDDGDALRLAVRLNLSVAIRGHECEVFSEDSGDCIASVPILGASCFANPAEATNPYAATRRAIVRAAAAIGEGMKT